MVMPIPALLFAPPITVKYTVNKRFVEKLHRLGLSLDPKFVLNQLVAAATEAQESAQAGAPFLTGFLRDNIQVYIISDNQVDLVSEAWYSVPVEFGHVTRSGANIPAANFWRPAVQVGKQALFTYMNAFFRAIMSFRPPPNPNRSSSAIRGGGSPQVRRQDISHKYMERQRTITKKKRYKFTEPPIGRKAVLVRTPYRQFRRQRIGGTRFR